MTSNEVLLQLIKQVSSHAWGFARTANDRNGSKADIADRDRPAPYPPGYSGVTG